ncbi:nuclear pore complex protein Nup153 [Pelodytes ibericus]
MAAAGGGGGGGGGAGTGGKIRNRRYHLSSGRTPYSKNRQQGQQGIISRVTDTVKSIVPGWLQKYFNKEASATSERVLDTNELIVQQHMESRDNDDHHIYVDDDDDDDGPPPMGDRVTPDRVRLEEEPSTSRFSLSMPDVLTRPSLHRTNLNFSILDSPALHCQPSTSSAFPTGSSGFSLVKEIKDSTSQNNDDDNISTTSGFSSRASDKDVAVSKNCNAPPLWSPEADRSNSLPHNTSMSAKKPTFNLSAFGAQSPFFGNTSVLQSSQLGDSPFYPGKTTYGGAAARTSRTRGTPYQAPLRRQVKAKPANSQTYGVTSSTARRILQSLEKMSSPLADAKRIPSVSPPSLAEKSYMDVTDGFSKRKRIESSYPPVRKLITPKSVSIANTSLYIKPSLTPSGMANSGSRRLQSDKHKESRRNNVPDAPAVPQAESFSYPTFSTPASNGLSGSAGGKMMREKGSHYTTKPSEEVAELPMLPTVPLPLSTAALPSFNFSPLSRTKSPTTVSKPADSKATNLANKPLFTFSTPIVKSTESNAQSPGSSVGFTFSVPALKASSSTTLDNNMATLNSPAKLSMANNISAKKKDEDHGGFCKPAKTLKEGSVLDILKSPGFSSGSPAQTTPSKSPLSKPMTKVPFGEGNKLVFGLWQCNACLHENRACDGKCVACSAAKDQSAEPPKALSSNTPGNSQKDHAPLTGFQGFGDKFKVAAGTWDCDTCFVQNKPEVTKCVACETPKPGTGVKAALLLPPVSKEKSAAAPQLGFQFDEKFKKPVGTWECSVCSVENKAEDRKCVACTSEKPGASPVTNQTAAAPPLSGQFGLLDQFKKPSGSWDCDTCFVQNKPEAMKCIACENAKPGTKAELKGTSTDSTLTTNAPAVGFSFPKVTGDFKFGIASSATKTADEKKDGGFSFGKTMATSNQGSAGFQFGTSVSSPADKDKINSPVTSGFSIGTASSTAASAPTTKSPASSGLQSQLTKDKSNLTTTFGLKESDDKNQASAVTGFSFGNVEQNRESTSSSSFVFGRKDDKTESTASGSSLLFGKKSEGEEPKPYAFGKPEQTKDSTTAANTFAFAVSNPAEKKDADQAAKSIFAFGSQTNPTVAAITTTASQQTFSFMTSGSTSGAQSSSSISSSVFGSTTQSSSQANPSAVFGSAAPSSTHASSNNMFGTAVPTSAPSVASGVFGSAAPSVASINSGSVFGSTIPSGAPTSSIVFGSSVPPSTAPSSSSMFGAAALNPSAGSSAMFSSVVPPSTTSSSVFGSAAPISTSTNSNSMFGNAGTAPNPTGTFVFGQPSSTASGPVFGNATESKSSFVLPVTSTTTASVTPFVFGAGATSTTSAAAGFSFGATNTSTATGTNSSPFIFGGATPATSGLPAANPAFGQSTSQPNAPAFGTSTSTPLFPAGSQSVPGFGSLTSSVQPPLFGQQTSTQPAFGSSTVPAAGSGFQFGGNTNFNFASGGSPAVFTFGSNAAGASAQPAAPSGFAFNQPPAFNMGANGRNAAVSSISNRKIKTARRRK